MPYYLGNFRIDENIEANVTEAAKNCKRDIRFLLTPMPINNEKILIEEKYVDGFGCIAVYDGKKDCSKFWREFEKIKNNPGSTNGR